jgi:hypothetical protein
MNRKSAARTHAHFKALRTKFGLQYFLRQAFKARGILAPLFGTACVLEWAADLPTSPL